MQRPPSPRAARQAQHQQQSIVVAAACAVGGVVLVAAAATLGGGCAADACPEERPPAVEAAATPEFAPVDPPTAPSAPASPTDPASPSPPSQAPSPGTPAPSPDTPAPTASPVPASLPHAEPTRVEIPELGIASDLVDLGLNDDGSLEVPSDYDLAGWYADGPAPGDAESPPAVIVGHVDSTTGPAVFFQLRQVREGQRIDVTREDGSVAVFRVRDATQYPKSALPADEVYATRPASELVLITCDGEFDPVARSYLSNFVVTAELDVEASSDAA